MEKLPTKQKILDAATKLFVKHGFAGTSMGNIAKLARVNHSLIFHHFQNKALLWDAVKQNIAQFEREKSKVLPGTNLPFPDFLHQLVTNSVQFYHDHPEILRMIHWQRLEKTTQQNEDIQYSEEMQAWLKAFEDYQKQGEINSALDTRYIVVLILSITSSAVMDLAHFIEDPQQYLDFVIDNILLPQLGLDSV